MTAKKKIRTFKDLNEIKDFIRSKSKKINDDVNEVQGFVRKAFGEFPKDSLSLIEFIEKVIEIKETEKK